MGLWSLKDRGTLSGRWKLLVASVLAAGLIGLLCGLCESSTKAVCMNTLTAIASSLSLIDQKTNAPQNKSKRDTTSPGTIPLTITTSKTSLKDYAATSLRKLDIFIAANTARKTSGLTTMRVSSTAHLTIGSSIKKSKALLPMRAAVFKNYGRMVSAPLVNSTSKRQLILPATYSKRLLVIRRMTPICATTETALLTGSNLLTRQCR